MNNSARSRALWRLLVDTLWLLGASAFVIALGWRSVELVPERAAAALASASEVMAGVLAVATTVVAIVVQLAATRYSHRITVLFIGERVNLIMLSLFAVTTIVCLWFAIAVPSDGSLPVGFWVTLSLLALSLILLLPYLRFVFTFISPLNVIERIRSTTGAAVRAGGPRSIAHAKAEVRRGIDQLYEIGRGALEQSDRAIAMACIDALEELLLDYQRQRAHLPESWRQIDPDVASDADFVGFAPSLLAEFDASGVWLEVKVLRQYLSLMLRAVPDNRDEANLISLRTRAIAQAAADRASPSVELLTLCIRCFNSYLRTAINADDRRSAYYTMDQYRELAEVLAAKWPERTLEIARHLGYYGQLGHTMGHSFLLEAAAFDVAGLTEHAAAAGQDALVDGLLGVLLGMDQEIRSERQEASLLGVRFAQMQLAARLLGRGDETRARRIVADLAEEDLARLDRIRTHLLDEEQADFWEFTDRPDTFRYLEPEYRPQLDTLLAWVGEAAHCA